jgi:1-acyl-sn-glycerol-3-phosphate acyltransferase
VTAYIRGALRGHFDEILLFGEREEFDRDDAYPLIFFSTHQSWWDGFLEIPLMRRYHQDLLLMMDEKNLRKFQAFRSVGVFGVNLDSPSGRASALLYAGKRLRDPVRRRALYLYPHGTLLAPNAPWPPFQGGVAELLRLCPAARAVPVAKQLFHDRQRHPSAWIQLGNPMHGSTAELETALRSTADALYKRVAHRDVSSSVTLLPPKRWATGRT